MNVKVSPLTRIRKACVASQRLFPLPQWARGKFGVKSLRGTVSDEAIHNKNTKFPPKIKLKYEDKYVKRFFSKRS